MFGEGPAHAAVVFVGEQPGDQEDLQGKPFVGPAGQLFDRALEEAGIDRARVYVTNAVKHFKFEPRGKRRIHKKPNNAEIEACRWWLDNELRLLKPQLTVALGATAARALTGRDTTISRARGKLMPLRDGRRGLHHGAPLVPAAAARCGVEGAGIRELRRRPEAGGAAPAGDPEGGLSGPRDGCGSANLAAIRIARFSPGIRFQHVSPGDEIRRNVRRRYRPHPQRRAPRQARGRCRP